MASLTTLSPPPPPLPSAEGCYSCTPPLELRCRQTAWGGKEEEDSNIPTFRHSNQRGALSNETVARDDWRPFARVMLTCAR